MVILLMFIQRKGNKEYLLFVMQMKFICFTIPDVRGMGLDDSILQITPDCPCTQPWMHMLLVMDTNLLSKKT